MGAGESCDPNPCVSAAEEAAQAASLRLTPAPNPSTGLVVINYTLPKSTGVAIAVFDASGTLVRRLADGHRPKGTFATQWDGRDDNENTLPSGVYLIRMVTIDGTTTRRMVVAR